MSHYEALGKSLTGGVATAEPGPGCKNRVRMLLRICQCTADLRAARRGGSEEPSLAEIFRLKTAKSRIHWENLTATVVTVAVVCCSFTALRPVCVGDPDV